MSCYGSSHHSSSHSRREEQYLGRCTSCEDGSIRTRNGTTHEVSPVLDRSAALSINRDQRPNHSNLPSLNCGLVSLCHRPAAWSARSAASCRGNGTYCPFLVFCFRIGWNIGDSDIWLFGTEQKFAGNACRSRQTEHRSEADCIWLFVPYILLSCFPAAASQVSIQYRSLLTECIIEGERLGDFYPIAIAALDTLSRPIANPAFAGRFSRIK